METSTSTNWKEEIEQILKEASAIIDEVERSMQDNNDKHDSKTSDTKLRSFNAIYYANLAISWYFLSLSANDILCFPPTVSLTLRELLGTSAWARNRGLEAGGCADYSISKLNEGFKKLLKKRPIKNTHIWVVVRQSHGCLILDAPWYT